MSVEWQRSPRALQAALSLSLVTAMGAGSTLRKAKLHPHGRAIEKAEADLGHAPTTRRCDGGPGRTRTCNNAVMSGGF